MGEHRLPKRLLHDKLENGLLRKRVKRSKTSLGGGLSEDLKAFGASIDEWTDLGADAME